MSKATMDLTVGIVLICLSLGILTVLVFYCRRIIERIARSPSRSVREISRDLRRDG